MSPLTKLLIKLGFFSYFLLTSFNNYASFLDDQLKFSRVKQAYHEKKPIITQKLTSMDVKMDDFEVMIKAYKYEQIVKIYIKPAANQVWEVYKTFPFNCTSGDLGPKRAQGDYQIPEGYYHVMHFNPYSNFLLSLGVSYPNKADKINSDAHDKGGAIYMHGGCATIGCIPIEDEPIKEVYILAVLGKNNGQTRVPIHIFPFQYSDQKMENAIKLFPEHKAFWTNLFDIERKFDLTKKAPSVSINNQGLYELNN